MMPRTVNNMAPMVLISMIQKCIRRGMEAEAMEATCEMLHTSKAFCTMVCNRLEVISHEDIDTISQPHIVPFVATACEQAKRHFKKDNPNKSRLFLGNAIRMMCRAAKSREGDHFQASFGLRSLIDGHVPKVPDFVFDMHTQQGRRQGRGLEHFRTESTMLVPPAESDQYEADAYNMWALKEGCRNP